MRILFDQGTPVPLKRYLQLHEVETAFERGWSRLQNGELLNAAEQASFDVLITTDKNLRYQQNLSARRITIVVLSSTSWPRIRQHTNEIAKALETIAPGSYQEITINF